MTGGIIQLSAYGEENLFLSKDPQITFFKIVYRRHTNFSIETMPQSFDHPHNFGKKVSCRLSRNADLIRKIHVVIVLPKVPTFKDDSNQIDPITKFAWIRKIGYGIINNIEIVISGELIDRHYGDWLNIWNEITLIKQKNLSKMIGDIKILTDFTNGKKEYKLFIPLQFWFNRLPGLALPIVSLQYNDIIINVELNEFKNCHLISPTHYINIADDFVNYIPYEYITQTVNGITSLGKFIYFDLINRRLYISRVTDDTFKSLTETDLSKIQTEDDQNIIIYKKDEEGNFINSQYFIKGLTSNGIAMPRINSTEIVHKYNKLRNINLKDCFLLVEYIFLDDNERIKFLQARHEYLIEQVFFNDIKNISGINQLFKVSFTQPSKEIIWVTQLSSALDTKNNDIFNYTDSLIRDINGNLIGNNIILNETILFNSVERISLRDSNYFSFLQQYQNHTGITPNGVNIYSFGLHPQKHQPSGTSNLSKIDNIELHLIVSPQITFKNNAKLKVYSIAYNVLRIANGVSGLVFSIDNIQ
jgi:hypothetical protein